MKKRNENIAFAKSDSARFVFAHVVVAMGAYLFVFEIFVFRSLRFSSDNEVDNFAYNYGKPYFYKQQPYEAHTLTAGKKYRKRLVRRCDKHAEKSAYGDKTAVVEFSRHYAYAATRKRARKTPEHGSGSAA